MQRHVNRDGYTFRVFASGPPQYEYRRVAELFLGRRLKFWEEVHHINGIRSDNRAANLCVMSRYDHRRYHNWQRWMFRSIGNYPRLVTRIDRLRSLFNGILIADLI